MRHVVWETALHIDSWINAHSPCVAVGYYSLVLERIEIRGKAWVVVALQSENLRRVRRDSQWSFYLPVLFRAAGPVHLLSSFCIDLSGRC